jgi:hypothetical protein
MMWLGGVASAVLLSVGCGRMMQTGGSDPMESPQSFFGALEREARGGDLAQFHYPSDRGYNGTIADLGSSIDPRTPEKAGTQGRSRMVDMTGYLGKPDLVAKAREARMSQAIGGSGSEGQAPDSSKQGPSGGKR